MLPARRCRPDPEIPGGRLMGFCAHISGSVGMCAWHVAIIAIPSTPSSLPPIPLCCVLDVGGDCANASLDTGNGDVRSWRVVILVLGEGGGLGDEGLPARLQTFGRVPGFRCGASLYTALSR